jgi:hypothetical protein
VAEQRAKTRASVKERCPFLILEVNVEITAGEILALVARHRLTGEVEKFQNVAPEAKEI